MSVVYQMKGIYEEKLNQECKSSFNYFGTWGRPPYQIIESPFGPNLYFIMPWQIDAMKVSWMLIFCWIYCDIDIGKYVDIKHEIDTENKINDR